jgi:hypothetical protein
MMISLGQLSQHGCVGFHTLPLQRRPSPNAPSPGSKCSECDSRGPQIGETKREYNPPRFVVKREISDYNLIKGANLWQEHGKVWFISQRFR